MIDLQRSVVHNLVGPLLMLTKLIGIMESLSCLETVEKLIKQNFNTSNLIVIFFIDK